MNMASTEKALVSQIVHGSFVDGYGVRTTVFLKGCPLRCIWCCNPEGQLASIQLKYTAADCDGCGRCLPACPTDAITLEETSAGTKARIDRQLCNDCGKCIDVCFSGALDRFGKYYTVDELFDEVKKDERYFSSSGGGVTIGGGEPTMYATFLRKFLKKCRDRYIHTAVDTCLYTTTEEGFKALEEADLLLCDIKGIDPEQHLKNTGVRNEVIIANLKKLSAMGKPMIIRIPIIPGYNASPEDLQAVADFICELRSVERVDLLPVHEYGKVKYDQLGKQYCLVSQAISQERQDEIKAMYEKRGLKAQLGG